MLISIVGPRYSGKSTIESYLVANKAFASLRLTSGSSSTGSIIDAPDLQVCNIFLWAFLDVLREKH